jgi:hypothetical protein
MHCDSLSNHFFPKKARKTKCLVCGEKEVEIQRGDIACCDACWVCPNCGEDKLTNITLDRFEARQEPSKVPAL